MQKYKLGDFLDNYGDGIHGTPKYDINGDYYFINGSNLGNGKIVINDDIQKVSAEEYTKIRRPIVNGQTILVSINGTLGKFAIYHGEKIGLGKSACFLNLKEAIYVPFIFAILMTKEFKTYLHNIAGQSTIKNVSPNQIANYEFYAPSSLCDCIAYSQTILKINEKIELNRQINDNLEAMAKQLYDYWFVQFDFPNEEEKPYKSSGGAMVWNEELHMNIPYSWNTCLLNDYIGSNNTGDWGFDEPAEKRDMKVGCIRGADIVKLNDLPTRYIKDSNTSKLLSVWDIVIEVSGGSPTQATGRSAFVTPGVLKRNGGNLTCSNFCHAFTMKNYKASAYFFFMWRMFYDNNNMFNYEGKTSGIKNFMTDTFLANKWLDVPTALLDLFFERIKVIYEQIDNNIEEINALTKQRDELLPLLMNGQASVNYHLFALFLSSLILY